jgi:hypothetical protein
MDQRRDTFRFNIQVNNRGGLHVEHDGGMRVTHGPQGSARHDVDHAGAAHGTHGGAAHGTHSSGRHEHAPRDAGAGHLWKVVLDGKEYAIQVTRGEMTIVLEGKIVWRGERGGDRTYRAHWSHLHPDVEEKVLHHARSGDPVPHDHRAAAPPPSGPRPSTQHAPAPRADKPAAKTTPKKKTAPKKTAPKKTKETTPKKAAATVEVAAHSRHAPGSRPPAEQKPVTQREPGVTAATNTARKPEQPKAQRPVDDESVMSALKQGMEQAERDGHSAPGTTASVFPMMRDAWFNGARERVLAWKGKPKGESIAGAYAVWAGKNRAEVRTLAADVPKAA